MMKRVALATALLSASAAFGQTFKRLGGCPQLGCVFPPDQVEILAGTYFDIRLEIHAPVNGSEAYNGGSPDTNFTFCLAKDGGSCRGVTDFFDLSEPTLERWNFTWYEDLFAQDAGTPSLVNVASKAYRNLRIYDAGDYQGYLKYYNGSMTTLVNWTVKAPASQRKAKNVLLFIGDGMTQSMITAARMIAHKSINGKYQSLMQLDQMDNLGLQMTHSMDSFITDSANSATALYTGHKSTVNALNVYADSSKSSFDDPKFESMFELFKRQYGGGLGMVSKAYIADATPAAMCSHTRDRGQYASIVYEYLNGASGLNATIPWNATCGEIDVIFGGGAEQFYPGSGSYNRSDMYKAFADKGYQLVYNETGLSQIANDQKTLGIFSVSNMAKWLDIHVYPDTLPKITKSPLGDGSPAVDQPGLRNMTLKAIDILQARSNGKGWMMMSEAASIDKMMHVLDYDRALGELLELDDTVKASIAHLKEIGEYENTLIVVTADHGHGFDVFGSADTEYLAAQTDDRKKRSAIGVYQMSGLSGYTVANGSRPNNDTVVYGSDGPGFPVQWDPRYTYAAGFAANPDHREGYAVNKTGPRLPATNLTAGTDYYVNPVDQPSGFVVNGTLPTNENQGVHSLTDVSVFANGPGSELFRGVYNSVDIYFKICEALALGYSKKQ